MKITLLTIFWIFFMSIIGIITLLSKISIEEFPILAPIFFYSFFFLSTFSLFTLIGYYVRRISNSKINKYISYSLSFRQGILLGIFSCSSAYYLHMGIFTWWIELFTLFVLLFIEVIYTIYGVKNIRVKDKQI